MAKTAFSTSDNLTVKRWSEKLYRDTVKESYFSKFMGKGATSLCQTNEVLSKSQGDNITFGLRERLSGAGVTSGVTLEGNEEKLSFYNYNVLLEEYAHAVRDAGPLDRQRPAFDMDSESMMALRDWGSEKIDSLCFKALFDTPTRVFYRTSSGNVTTGTAATAKGALTAADSKMTPSIIEFARTWAKTGGNRTKTPIRPIKIEGKEYYVLLVHPDVAYDLRQDSTWTQANREARERAKSNPIFSGALGVWGGVIIHDHEGYPEKDGGLIATDGGSGSNVAWAQCALMGQQALLWAWGKRGKLVQETFDYGREHGFGWNMICGVEKPQFNSQDYGCAHIYVARTQISDAS